MGELEGRVCPWIGCGGTIVRKETANTELFGGWVCGCCGEPFKSVDEYKDKVRRETRWAEAWSEWSDHDIEPIQQAGTAESEEPVGAE